VGACQLHGAVAQAGNGAIAKGEGGQSGLRGHGGELVAGMDEI
jgi:hypothetical protein